MTEAVYKVVIDHMNRNDKASIKTIAVYDKRYSKGKEYNNPVDVKLDETSITFKYLDPELDHEFLKRYIAQAYIAEDYSQLVIPVNQIQKISFNSLVCDIV